MDDNHPLRGPRIFASCYADSISPTSQRAVHLRAPGLHPFNHSRYVFARTREFNRASSMSGRNVPAGPAKIKGTNSLLISQSSRILGGRWPNADILRTIPRDRNRSRRAFSGFRSAVAFRTPYGKVRACFSPPESIKYLAALAFLRPPPCLPCANSRLQRAIPISRDAS